MRIIIKNWKHITEVPYLTYEWAKLIAGDNVSIEEINELVNEYEEYIRNIEKVNHTL